MAQRTKTTAIKCLFIGNSFTARNDVPGQIERLAVTRQNQFEHKLIQAGGASLRMHWNKGEAQREIEGGNYDLVTLQEQSTLPIKNMARFHENVRLFDAASKAAHSQTVLYQTWARQNAPETQAILNEAYQSIGTELGALVVPVGFAWQRALLQHDEIKLYDKDLSHPTLAGSYLAACVFYATLFQDNPTKATYVPPALSPAHAAQLRQIAWEICAGQKNV